MKIFASNYRGFEWVEIDLEKVNFLVGDNSSGKSSLIYLVDTICNTDLNQIPKLDENLGVGEFDYFSPYFNYADVIFGYSTRSTVNHFVKIITVKRVKGYLPRITRCSYFTEDIVLSFRMHGDNLQAKIGPAGYIDNKSLISVHNDNKGYKYVDDEEDISICNPSLILTTFDAEHKDISRKTFRYAVENILNSTRIVSPTRALPEKYYNFRRKFSTHGLHFAAMWRDFSGIQDYEGFPDIDQFGRDSSLFDHVYVDKISNKIDDSPLIVSVEKSGKKFLLNQVGVGVSQVVPVLIETVYALSMDDISTLMQQPELHLHPIAQAALGSYFFKVSSKGLRPIIETHSSYLLDRFRADLRDSTLERAPNDVDVEQGGSSSDTGFTHEDVRILFCENQDCGNKIYPIHLSAAGELLGEPDQYHKFFVDELVRTMF